MNRLKIVSIFFIVVFLVSCKFGRSNTPTVTDEPANNITKDITIPLVWDRSNWDNGVWK